MKFPDPGTAEGLAFLDNYLLDKSYLDGGVAPTQADTKLFKAVREADLSGDAVANVRRWYVNIKSFGDEQKQFPPAGQFQVEIELAEKPKEVDEVLIRCVLLLFYFGREGINQIIKFDLWIEALSSIVKFTVIILYTRFR